MGIDNMAFALQTLGQQSGGVIGKIAGIASQLRFLKRGFMETARTADQGVWRKAAKIQA